MSDVKDSTPPAVQVEDSKPPAVQGYTVFGTIPQSIKTEAEIGIKKACEQCKVVVPKGTSYDFDQSVARLGNRCLAANTKATYNDILNQLYRYCIMKGDYESTLCLLLPPSIDNVPPMDVETLEQFVRLKRSPPNQELLALDGTPVLDVDGSQIF